MEVPPSPGGGGGDGAEMLKMLQERVRKRRRSSDVAPLASEREGVAEEEGSKEVLEKPQEPDAGNQKYNIELVRDAVDKNLMRYRPARALRHLRGFPGFDAAFIEEASWRARREADVAGKLLHEAGPMDFSRQDVLDFDASSYNDTLREVAPLITSTVTAACSRGTQVNILTETGLTQSGHPALRRSRPRRAWVGLAGNSTSSQSSIRPSAGSSS
jgi:hypothetical protein